MVRETKLSASDFVAPFFVTEGNSTCSPIKSLPNQYRYSIDLLLKEVESMALLGVPAILLFPVIDPSLKDATGSISKNRQALLPVVSRLRHGV